MDTMLLREDLPVPFKYMTHRALEKLIDRGEFPRPIRIGKMYVWPEPEVSAHMAALVKGERKSKSDNPKWSPEYASQISRKGLAARRAKREIA